MSRDGDSTSGDRWQTWLIDHLPQRVAAAPERILINAACAAIGLSALLGLLIGGGPRPSSLLALWPLWLSYEWAVAMLVGGLFALVGYLRGVRSVERFGYLLLCASAVLYGISAVVVWHWRGAFTAVIFLGIAASKAVRLLVTSAARSSVIRQGRDPGQS